MLARINLWTFTLPSLAQRREDIEPNLDYELERFARDAGRRVTMNTEARKRFLTFAVGSDAAWSGNFRDLGGAITRMATLASGGRIDEELVDEELVDEELMRLQQQWQQASAPTAETDDDLLRTVIGERMTAIDLFDQVQLRAVIAVCRRTPTLSAAGRTLFAISRQERKTANDADRLQKYLARFGLDWAAVR